MSKNRVTVVCERGAWHAGHKPRALAVFEREHELWRMDCAGWRAVQVQGKDRESDQARLYPVVGLKPVFVSDDEAIRVTLASMKPKGGKDSAFRKLAEARLHDDRYHVGTLVPCEHVLGRRVFEDDSAREVFQPCVKMLAVCPCGWPSSVVTLCSIVDKLEEAARGTGVIHIEDIASGGEETYVHNHDFTRQFEEWQRRKRAGSRAVGDQPYPATEITISPKYVPFVIMCDGNSSTANYHKRHKAHVLAVIPMPTTEADTPRLCDVYSLEKHAVITDGGNFIQSSLLKAQGMALAGRFRLTFDACPCCRTDLPAFTGLDLWDACKPLYDHGARFVNVNTVLTILAADGVG